MPLFRSIPLARNDSVDVIIGTGIVLELPSGFSSLFSEDINILLPIQFSFLLFSPPVSNDTLSSVGVHCSFTQDNKFYGSHYIAIVQICLNRPIHEQIKHEFKRGKKRNKVRTLTNYWLKIVMYFESSFSLLCVNFVFRNFNLHYTALKMDHILELTNKLHNFIRNFHFDRQYWINIISHFQQRATIFGHDWCDSVTQLTGSFSSSTLFHILNRTSFT